MVIRTEIVEYTLHPYLDDPSQFSLWQHQGELGIDYTVVWDSNKEEFINHLKLDPVNHWSWMDLSVPTSLFVYSTYTL